MALNSAQNDFSDDRLVIRRFLFQNAGASGWHVITDEGDHFKIFSVKRHDEHFRFATYDFQSGCVLGIGHRKHKKRTVLPVQCLERNDFSLQTEFRIQFLQHHNVHVIGVELSRNRRRLQFQKQVELVICEGTVINEDFAQLFSRFSLAG